MTSDSKGLSRRIFEEVWNKQNLSAADEIIASNFVDHDPQSSVQGLEGYQQFVRYYLTAFPDSHFTVEDEISEGTSGRDAVDGQRHAQPDGESRLPASVAAGWKTGNGWKVGPIGTPLG